MGLYSYLANLSLQAFDDGERARAAEIARTLDSTWDRHEEKEHGGGKSLETENPRLFKEIDHAMDECIEPIEGYLRTPPNEASLRSACGNYLTKLKLAN